MTQLIIDIETIPSQRPGVIEEIRANIQPPATFKKPESIAEWMKENADTAADELYRKQSFDGSKGEIVCIGWAVGNDAPRSAFRDVGQSEADMLGWFFNSVLTDEYEIIGHNVLAFDIRFLYQRSVINRVKPTFNLWQNERYTGGKVFDTMTAWAGWGNRISLKNLCAALEIPVKTDGLDGSKVFDYWKDGRIEEIQAYCKTDVEATRS